MFKIKDGKIQVFSKFIQMLPGTHTVKVDKETGSLSYSGNGDDVVTYTLDEDTGKITITPVIGTGYSAPFKAPTKARSWMNGRKISSGPLYGDNNLGVGGKEINVYLEGFAFDFNYVSVASVATAVKPFRWTGGRVCFDNAFGAGGYGNNQGKYTALPAAMSCGRSFINEYETGQGQIRDIANIYGAPTSGVLHSAQMDMIEFYGNSVSIVFSYRSFRKYLSFAHALTGIFESSIGTIGASGGSVEPDGSFPQVFDASFKFSMFNLKQ